ncbi:MAG: hypothetical protein SGILL_000771, partial [Bacillariaceae sp.]
MTAPKVQKRSRNTMMDRRKERRKMEGRRGSNKSTSLVATTLVAFAFAFNNGIHDAEALASTPYTARTTTTKSSGSIPPRVTENDTLSSYIQWRKNGSKDSSNNSNGNWDMQTKVTTFQKGSKKVELHAQLHYGDERYYAFWNSPEFNSKFDKVLFELLLDDSLLEYSQSENSWKVTQPIAASQNDQAVALQYGWQCQADALNYQANKNWAHADLTRQEFVEKIEQQNGNAATAKDSASSTTPLWKLASSNTAQSSSTAAEAVAALMVGPPTLLSVSKDLKRRLFTNLFLPGDSFALLLRTILWWTVPCPELSIILLDWSSLLQGQRQRGNGRGLSTSPTSSSVPFSEVALPILTSLVQFNLPQMRRFLFGQVLLSSSSGGGLSASNNDDNEAWSLLVTQRNDHALKVAEAALEKSNTNTIALLYGSSHCPDLHQKLIGMGFQPTSATWRTAWSVQGSDGVDTSNKSNNNNNNATILPALAAALVFYLGVGALDWVGMLGNVSESLLDKHDYVDAGVEASLYLLRHVLLYLGFSKFLVDWTNNT